MNQEAFQLRYRQKVIIIFIDYFVFSLFALQTHKFIKYTLNLNEFINFYAVLLICYLIYFSLFELFINKSLIMFLFKVELSEEKRNNSNFVFYVITSIFDRTIFMPLHILLTIMNYENPLLCEKVSGVKWIKKGE